MAPRSGRSCSFALGIAFARRPKSKGKGGRKPVYTAQHDPSLDAVLKLMVKDHSLSRACTLATGSKRSSDPAARTLRRRLTKMWGSAKRLKEVADLLY